jgi:hypothetical protein
MSESMFELPSPAIIFAAILFGMIGTAAFFYGKKQQKPRALGLGVALCVYPYFILDSVWLMWIVGAALTAALWFWRDD